MQTKKITNNPYYIIIFVVLLACLILIFADGQSHSLDELLSMQGISAIMLFFVPAYFVCSILYGRLSDKFSKLKSYVLSLSIGIVACFGLEIVFFLVLKKYF